MSVKADDNFAARANARERDKVAEGRDGQLDEDALPWGNLVGSREVSVLVGAHGLAAVQRALVGDVRELSLQSVFVLNRNPQGSGDRWPHGWRYKSPV